MVCRDIWRCRNSNPKSRSQSLNPKIVVGFGRVEVFGITSNSESPSLKGDRSRPYPRTQREVKEITPDSSLPPKKRPHRQTQAHIHTNIHIERFTANSVLVFRVLFRKPKPSQEAQLAGASSQLLVVICENPLSPEPENSRALKW